MGNAEEIRAKLFESLDPNSEYTQEDFLREYSQPVNPPMDVQKIPLKFLNT